MYPTVYGPVESLQSHMILTMSHWSSGLTCMLPATSVTDSNPLGGTNVKLGFSCKWCLATGPDFQTEQTQFFFFSYSLSYLYFLKNSCCRLQRRFKITPRSPHHLLPIPAVAYRTYGRICAVACIALHRVIKNPAVSATVALLNPCCSRLQHRYGGTCVDLLGPQFCHRVH